MNFNKHILQKYFGNKKPIFTKHALQRYAERVYHVSSNQYNGWINIRHVEICKEILLRLSNSELYTPTVSFKKYLDDTYPKSNLYFLIQKNMVFIFDYGDEIKLITIYIDKDKNHFL